MADTRNPAIVVVDDEPDVLRAIARDLRRQYGESYRVIRASSGAEAVDAVQKLTERGDAVALVLSDQRMPDLDGVATLKRVAEIAPAAKRAMLTAYADTDAAIGAINSGRIDYYLLKPWDPPEEKLFPVLDDLLADWRGTWRPGFGGFRLIADRWSSDGHRLRDFLSRNQIPYTFLDVERDESACELASGATLPLVVTPDGAHLENPTNAEVAQASGLSQTAEREFYDLAIIGGGPAGLASAVYGASEGLKTVLIEREAPGGQAGTSSRIENYLGFPSGLSGADLARRGVSQAKRFGVEILAPVSVESIRAEGPYKILSLSTGSEVACHALMLATGVDWRTLPASGADEMAGQGVYYGAAMTEAIGCQDEHVFVVGAGNSAGQAALHFAEYAAQVTILVRGDDLAKSMSQYLVDRIEAHEQIEVCLGHEIEACHGNGHLERITIRDREGGGTTEVETHYVFVFIGATPQTDWLGDFIARDDKGFVRTGPDLTPEDLAHWPLARDPFLLETSVPGVFVAGDVRHESVKRVASAVGEGSVAVAFVHQHLASL
ncbi:FAD-dependent oxidoreductase [Rubricoccus marinus]|uniref:Fused response regulator/thioredoxin-disulfide reductase n=1 Tax=Rubricoccus marinus TaxID=716817 RepID=A0A259U022_9BACT|nr:FAD-dependent oxidoreductase [Rubricoccus marinus]OZC03373.1 fused response regulator/thioredoxin-disulfide reductase [Rubricoccus marinus]